MYCSNCGTQNKEDANYCRQCGRSFQKSSTNPLPEVNHPNQQRAFKKLFTGVALLGIASIMPGMLWWMFFIGILMVVKGIRLLSAARFTTLSTSAQIATTPLNRMQDTSSH